MAKASSKKENSLTLLVFKDDLVARSFSIPLKWFTQLGLSLGGIGAVILILIFLSAKYYRLSLKSDPARILDLERELTDLRQSYASLQDQLAKLPKPAEPVAGAPEDTNVAATPPAETAPTPNTTPVASAPPTPVVTSPSTPTEPTSASATEIPIQLGGFETTWVGSHLIVRFHITYISKDGGNQQGRIGVVLKGATTNLSYPKAVLKNAATLQLAPERGEFFSVSRYREVRAEFDSVPTGQEFKEIQIYIFEKGGEVLIEKTIKAPPFVPTSGTTEDSNSEPASGEGGNEAD